MHTGESKKTGCVYLITDNEYFYVGYTERPVLARFGQHLRDSCYKQNRSVHNVALYQWLRRIVTMNVMPQIITLKTNATKQDEDHYIKEYSAKYGKNCMNIESNDHRQRWNVGEKHGMSKMTEDDVVCVRMAFNCWEGDRASFCKEMSKRFGVHPGNIRHIILNKTWKNIKRNDITLYAFLDNAWNFAPASLRRFDFENTP